MTLHVVCPLGHSVDVSDDKLGREVACPRCFSTFLAEIPWDSDRRARKEERKPRRSRDDDDDDEDDDDEEEDEKPRKKKKPARDEGDKPGKKKKPARDDDDDDDDDDEDEGEPEEEIEWTPRKRALNLCSIGLVILIVAMYFQVAFVVFASLAIDIWEILEDWRNIAMFMFNYLAMPLMLLSVIGNVVMLFMNLAVPAKAEGRGPIIAGLVFYGLVFVLAILIVLTWFDFLMSDAERRARMLELLAGGAVLCFLLGLISTMGYLSKLMIFMRQHLYSSQPVTNGGFILLCYAILLALVYISPMLKSGIGTWMGWVVAFAADITSCVVIRVLVMHALLLGRLRGTIAAYIRDS